MAYTIVEEKIENIGKETVKNLSGNKELEEAVKHEIRLIINEEKVKTNNEEVNDLAKIISEKLGIENNSEIKIEAKKIRIEVEKWCENNIKQVDDFKKEEFKNKFVEETKKLNPDLKEKQLESVKKYAEEISEIYVEKNEIDLCKNEILEANNQFSPGQLENGFTDLKGVVNFLKKSPEQIKGIKEKYNSIKNGLNDVKLPNLKETRSFENVMANLNGSSGNNLFSKTQKYLGWADKVDKLTGGWLNKTVTDAGMKMMNKIGSQAVQEFASNSLGVLAKEGFQKGFQTVLKGIMSGGVKAGATAAGGAAAGATAAGAAAVSATGVGAIAVAALAVLKFVKDKVGKIAEKLGISSKKFLEENFGKVGGKIIGGIASVVALPALLIGAMSAAIIGPILIAVFGGLFVYQMFQGSLVSSLVPPKGGEEENGIVAPFNGTYISSSGDISLPQITAGQTVSGEQVVQMASSLVNKVCYYYGGGHNHFWPPETEKGIGTNWGKKTYLDSSGTSKTFPNNTVFGSDNNRYIYGLDCSGFVTWVYHQFGIDREWWDSTSQYTNNKKISANELQLGDLGFVEDLGHVGIFSGRDSDGNAIWIHAGSGGYLDKCEGAPGFVKVGSYSGFTKYARVL